MSQVICSKLYYLSFNHINSIIGTDGHRTIGRIWHVSRLKNSSQAEAICWSTRNTLPLPQPEKIRSPLPLTIRGFCLCPATFKLYLTLAGRSRPRNGKPCSSVSSRGNRSVTSRVITACRMRPSGACCVPLVAAKWDVRARITQVVSRADNVCMGRQRTQRVHHALPSLQHAISVQQEDAAHTGGTWTTGGSQVGSRCAVRPTHLFHRS